MTRAQVFKHDPEWDEGASMGLSQCNRKLTSETPKDSNIVTGIVQREGTWDPVLSYQVGGELQH